MSEYSDLTVWIDGRLVRGAEAAVSVWDHGLLYGDGCFEGMRIRNRLLFRPRDHLTRLRGSARGLGIELANSSGEILHAIASVASDNNLGDAHVRLILTRGVGAPGLDPRRAIRPTLIVMAYPFPPLLGDRPVRLMISSIARKAPRSVDAQIKSLNYLDGILAKQQANAAGADDAVMLDDHGTVAEGTSTNLFIVREGVLATPTTRAALPGITRRTVIELLRGDGFRIIERSVTWGELYTADECFLTGSGAGIVPVAAVDGRELPEAPGPATTRARELYEQAVTSPQFVVDLSRLAVA